LLLAGLHGPDALLGCLTYSTKTLLGRIAGVAQSLIIEAILGLKGSLHGALGMATVILNKALPLIRHRPRIRAHQLGLLALNACRRGSSSLFLGSGFRTSNRPAKNGTSANC
jgi:hypothetical protein